MIVPGAFPHYFSELDALLFWMHVLKGHPTLFKQLLIESLSEIQELEWEAPVSSCITRDPSLIGQLCLSLC